MNPLDTIKRRGILGTASYAARAAGRRLGWYEFRFRNVPRYQAPTAEELSLIEKELQALGIQVEDYQADADAFREFQAAGYFPSNYHGGVGSGVWDEKLLEHFLAFQLLGLKNFTGDDQYVDIAACNSPWAHVLRTRSGMNAYAIDLEPGTSYRALPYYLQENATSTSFADAAVKGASLQCAFEMFMGEDDVDFITEAGRMLSPGGRLVILPLYMHTHYCAYSTPEYWGKGFSDTNAREYVRLDCLGVPSSRKYNAAMLKRRVIDPVQEHGMQYRLLALRNKEQLGNGIYCHFILEISR